MVWDEAVVYSSGHCNALHYAVGVMPPMVFLQASSKCPTGSGGSATARTPHHNFLGAILEPNSSVIRAQVHIDITWHLVDGFDPDMAEGFPVTLLTLPRWPAPPEFILGLRLFLH